MDAVETIQSLQHSLSTQNQRVIKNLKSKLKTKITKLVANSYEILLN
jgi:hypothetical protein